MQWAVIPDLSTRALSISSLLLGLQSLTVGSQTHSQWSIDNRFSRASRLRFMCFVYNAARTKDGLPDVTARIQVRRDGLAAAKDHINKITINEQPDLARLTLTDEIDLSSFAPGRYELVVTVEDHIAKTNVTRQTFFFVD